MYSLSISVKRLVALLSYLGVTEEYKPIALTTYDLNNAFNVGVIELNSRNWVRFTEDGLKALKGNLETSKEVTED